MEPLENRRLLTGVTLVTHGFNSDASGWVTAMGDLIAQQSGALATQPIYKLTVDNNAAGGAYEATVTQLGAPAANWGSQEIVVLLDWSDVAGNLPPNGSQRPTPEVANFVGDELLKPNLLPGFAPALADYPIQMIGHSRGGSLISEIARRLGEHGVWVDQLTYLDPHPVNGGGANFFFNFGDPAMAAYDNVRFIDDYYHLDPSNPSDFSGTPVNGADNVQLAESVLADAGSSSDHSDVHLWYHGTIGPPFVDSDGGSSVGSDWYNGSMGPRDQIGWHFSRIASGARPAAGLKTAGAHRDPVTLTVSGANVWDDVSIDNLTADTIFPQGSGIPVNTSFEDRSTGGLRDSTITIGLDRDDNPLDGFFGGSVSVATSTLGADTYSTNLPTGGIAGAFHVYAKISNAVNTRYYYAPGEAIVTVPGFDKTWTGPANGSFNTASNWTPAGVPTSTQSVAIYDSAVTLNATMKIAGLKLGGSATLDILNHDLVVDYSSASPAGTWNGNAYDGIAGLIATGKIRSSNISSGLYGIGVAEASQALNLSGVQTSVWEGQAVDASSVLVQFTYRGDANLDGRINVDDYGRIDSSAPLGIAGWYNGDFNYDGKTNVDDYGIIDFNVAIQGIPL